MKVNTSAHKICFCSKRACVNFVDFQHFRNVKKEYEHTEIL